MTRNESFDEEENVYEIINEPENIYELNDINEFDEMNNIYECDIASHRSRRVIYSPPTSPPPPPPPPLPPRGRTLLSAFPEEFDINELNAEHEKYAGYAGYAGYAEHVLGENIYSEFPGSNQGCKKQSKNIAYEKIALLKCENLDPDPEVANDDPKEKPFFHTWKGRLLLALLAPAVILGGVGFGALAVYLNKQNTETNKGLKLSSTTPETLTSKSPELSSRPNGTNLGNANRTYLDNGNGTYVGNSNGTYVGSGNVTYLGGGNGTYVGSGNGTYVGSGNGPGVVSSMKTYTSSPTEGAISKNTTSQQLPSTTPSSSSSSIRKRKVQTSPSFTSTSGQSATTTQASTSTEFTSSPGKNSTTKTQASPTFSSSLSQNSTSPRQPTETAKKGLNFDSGSIKSNKANQKTTRATTTKVAVTFPPDNRDTVYVSKAVKDKGGAGTADPDYGRDKFNIWLMSNKFQKKQMSQPLSFPNPATSNMPVVQGNFYRNAAPRRGTEAVDAVEVYYYKGKQINSINIGPFPSGEESNQYFEYLGKKSTLKTEFENR